MDDNLRKEETQPISNEEASQAEGGIAYFCPPQQSTKKALKCKGCERVLAYLPRHTKCPFCGGTLYLFNPDFY